MKIYQKPEIELILLHFPEDLLGTTPGGKGPTADGVINPGMSGGPSNENEISIWDTMEEGGD